MRRLWIPKCAVVVLLLLLPFLLLGEGGAVPQQQTATVYWTTCADKLCSSCSGHETVSGCFPQPRDNTSDMYDCVQQNLYVQISHYEDSISCSGTPSFTPLIPVGQCAPDGNGLYYKYECLQEPACVVQGVDWTDAKTVTWTARQSYNNVSYDWSVNVCSNASDLCPGTPAALQQRETSSKICYKQFTQRTGVSVGPGRVQWFVQDPSDHPATATVTVLCDPSATEIVASPDVVNVTQAGASWHYNLTLYAKKACAYY